MTWLVNYLRNQQLACTDCTVEFFSEVHPSNVSLSAVYKPAILNI